MGGEGCQSFSALLAPFWTIVSDGSEEGERVCFCFWQVVFDGCFFGLWGALGNVGVEKGGNVLISRNGKGRWCVLVAFLGGRLFCVASLYDHRQTATKQTIILR